MHKTILSLFLSLCCLVAIGGTADAKDVAVGPRHSCFIYKGYWDSPGDPGWAQVRCVGHAFEGELGDSYNNWPTWGGDPNDANVNLFTDAPPASSLGGVYMTNAVDVTVGYEHSCAILGGGALYCWGGNTYGQIGDNTTVNKYRPTLIVASGVTSVVAGNYHTCAVISGVAKCWGRNNLGQLGDNTATNRKVPTTVNGATQYNLRGLSASDDSMCAVGGGTGGSPTVNVYCWGNNAQKQISGTNGLAYCVTPQIHAFTGTGAMEALAGSGISCGRRVTTGDVYCWGTNTDLGISTGTGSTTPLLATVPSVSSLALPHFGGRHACKVGSNVLQCMGLRTTCRLGDGNWGANGFTPTCASTTASSWTTITLQTHTTWDFTALNEITSGGGTTCLVGASTYGGANTSSCWGDDRYAQTGSGAGGIGSIEPEAGGTAPFGR